MISPEYFINALANNNIDFFAGIPDSLLKSVCAYITNTCSKEKHVITANEGAAVGVAAGYHLATGKIPAVYMQNSGIGNAVNPLLSLVDKEVYRIPMLLLIGWRGEPGTKDEPQHIKQGKVTVPLLDSMGIKHCILSKEEKEVGEQLKHTFTYIEQTKEPFAILIPKGTFEESELPNTPDQFLLSRESALQTVASSISSEDIIVSTTGMISRELFEYRENTGQGHANDFLTVGSMGHASQIALGIAMYQKHRKIYCFDGDGALIMHMGNLAIISDIKPQNFVHIIFNNGAHDSVGGQPTAAFNIDIPKIASSCGYSFALSADNEDSLKKALDRISKNTGPALLEIKVKKGARKDLGRPTTSPLQNKYELMKFLSK
jgi:phosphonopyruvate decarboxylase